MDDPSNENISVTDNKAILATGGYDHTVKLWQAHSSVCYWTGQHADSQVNALCVTPDGQKLASAGYQHIRMYDLNSTNSNPIMNYENVSKNVTSVGFQEDGKWMFTTGEDTNARIWDLRNMHCHRIFQANAAINYAVLHPNQVELIMCDDNGIIHVWNLKNDRNEQLIPEQEATIQCVAVDPQGLYLAAVNNMGHCHIWSLSHDSQLGGVQLKPKHKILAHTRQALRCKFSPDSSFLVTTSADQSAIVWKTQDFSLYREMKIPSGQRWVWDAAFTNDSQYLITASSDGLARLWSIETGHVEREYSGHQKAVTALAFMDSTASY
ncbi:target of rapamycin complex subunit lst8 isoform X2 [Planococcus citri]|uniref:target of rapamycin complex subunit lst8 isoform X2 n=1 Tax=Planococcus citri TaxID=170843 RepID=UPI0031F8F00F